MSRIFQGPIPNSPVVKGNLISFIFKDSHRWQDLHALECGYAKKALTYKELRDAAGRWGAWVARHRGEPPQSSPTVARLSKCSVELAVVHLGTMAVGAVIAPLTTSFGARELARQIESNGASLIVASVEFLSRLRETLEKLGRQIPVVVIGDTATCDKSGLNIVGTYEQIMKDPTLKPMDPIDISGEETAFLMYTSGTTGLPKSVQHSHNSALEAVREIAHPNFYPHPLPTCDADQTRCLLFREFGLSIGLLSLLSGLSKGQCFVIKATDDESFVQDVEQFKINTTAMIPPNLPAVLRIGQERPDLLNTFRHFILGGGASSDAHLRALANTMPNVFVQRSYGTSEVGVISLNQVNSGKPGFTGQLTPNVRAKVLDSDGTLLPHNQKGYLYMTTPGMMKGYLNNPTATREVLDEEGWYNTGDVALVDEEGYVKVFDRVKEMIKLDDAHSASPAEIENTILELEGVHEVCVVGTPVRDTGMDAIYVFVVKKPNAASDVTEKYIQNYVTQQLNKQKRPKTVIFKDALGRNQNGKIDRSGLKLEASRLEN